MTEPKTKAEMAALSWACRRGMLELDLLLGQFLSRGFAALTPAEQALFEELLRSTDQDLYAWLLGSVAIPEPRFEPLLQKIREYVPCSST